MTTMPPPLKPGDTIGIVAPASHFNRERFDRGLAVLHDMGFQTRIPEQVFERSGYLAGADPQRAGTVNRLFADPEVDGIVCARGGYGSMRMLGYLDIDLIRRHPKVFVGFSDISALLMTLYQRCGFAVFHGPTVSTLAAGDAATREALAGVLDGSGRLVLEAADGNKIRAGTATGPLAGGNLTTLCHLLKTPFSPDFAGHILLLEDRGEAPYRIDRMLTQMRLAGCLTGVRGVVLGSFADCGETEEIHRIATDLFGDLGVPVLAGFEIGHGRTNLTVPLGVPASLDTDRRTLEFP